jgi:hypothetical protein
VICQGITQTHGNQEMKQMDEFNEWDQAWNLTESGLALIEAIEKAKQDGKL